MDEDAVLALDDLVTRPRRHEDPFVSGRRVARTELLDHHLHAARGGADEVGQLGNSHTDESGTWRQSLRLTADGDALLERAVQLRDELGPGVYLQRIHQARRPLFVPDTLRPNAAEISS